MSAGVHLVPSILAGLSAFVALPVHASSVTSVAARVASPLTQDAVAAPSDPLLVPVRDLGEESRDLHFDPAHRLPRPSETLEARLSRVLARRFDESGTDSGGASDTRDPGVGAGVPAWARSFGDLVQAFGPLRRDGRGTDALLARLEREQPAIWAEVRDVLPQLVRTARVYRDDWDPDDDEDDDGILMGKAYALDRRFEPWRSLEGDDDVQQGAQLAWADESALKQAEGDYTTYTTRPGSGIEEVGIVAGSAVRGLDERGEWMAYTVRTRADLPWPFSDYTSVVEILEERDARGRLVTHVWSSSEDFLWLAGRDTYVPVTNADGALVATLVVRELGFDLDGVPDGASDRRAVVRGPPGCEKRDGERRFAERRRAERAAAAGADADADADDTLLAEGAPAPGDPLPVFSMRSPR